MNCTEDNARSREETDQLALIRLRAVRTRRFFSPPRSLVTSPVLHVDDARDRSILRDRP